jgi:hypothetical protein
MARGRSSTAAPVPDPKDVLIVPSSDAHSDDMIEAICLVYGRLGEDFNKQPLALAGLGSMSRRRVRAQYKLALSNARRAGITCIEQCRQSDDDPMEIDF